MYCWANTEIYCIRLKNLRKDFQFIFAELERMGRTHLSPINYLILYGLPYKI